MMGRDGVRTRSHVRNRGMKVLRSELGRRHDSIEYTPMTRSRSVS